MKILVLMKYLRVQCSKFIMICVMGRNGVYVHVERIGFISPAVGITENTTQTKTENRPRCPICDIE